MIPLKISFFMRTPILLGWPWIHFDALLAHALARRELGSEYYTLPSKRAEEIVAEIVEKYMPLERFGDKDIYVWKGSVSFFEPKIVGGTTIYKRFSPRNLRFVKTRKKRVDLTRGYFKMYAMRIPTVTVKRVVFYAKGEKEEIEELLRHVPALGKKRVVGFGDIRKVVIEEIEKDHSLYMETQGKTIATRPIPLELLPKIAEERGRLTIKTDSVAYIGFRPPYWWKKNIAKCILPYTEI